MTNLVIDFGKHKQGSQPTIPFTWPLNTGVTPSDLTGFTLTATSMNIHTEAVASISGTFAVTDGAARTCTWALSAADSGTAGTYKITVKATDGSDTIYTLFGDLVIEENPSVTGTQNDPLVSITQDQANWVEASELSGDSATDGNLASWSSGNLADSSIPASWNATDMTIDITHNANVTGQVNQEFFVVARNNSGANITNGQVVKLTGSISSRPTISLAQADSVANARQIGVATEDIDNNSTGFVTVAGLVRGLNTNAYNEGDVLYLSTSVAGAFTTTKPTWPDIAIEVGIVVVKNASNGTIFVGAYETGAGAHEKAAAAQAAAEATAAALVDDLSGVTDAATARTNLGLGTIATAAADDYYLKTAFSASPGATAAPMITNASGGFTFGNAVIIPSSADVKIQPSGNANVGISMQSTGIITFKGGSSGSVSFSLSGAGLDFSGLSKLSSPPGGASSPGLAWSNDGDTGFFRIFDSGGATGVSCDGNEVARFKVAGAEFYKTPKVILSSPSEIGQIIQLAASQIANAFEVQDSTTAIQFAVGPTGQIKTNQDAANTNTPSGATAHQLPIYNEAGTLLGYIPVYGSAW